MIEYFEYFVYFLLIFIILIIFITISIDSQPHTNIEYSCSYKLGETIYAPLEWSDMLVQHKPKSITFGIYEDECVEKWKYRYGVSDPEKEFTISDVHLEYYDKRIDINAEGICNLELFNMAKSGNLIFCFIVNGQYCSEYIVENNIYIK